MLADEIRSIEAIERDADAKDALPRLRQALSLDAFGELMLQMPDGSRPRLSAILPGIVSAQEQEQWTSRSGTALLRVTVNWIRMLQYNYQAATGNVLEGTSFLDFGCGWGRVARLMLYFADVERVYGVDPWDRSIDLCRQVGLGDNFRLSERVPVKLPVPEGFFSLVHAFSVFTHLSPAATIQCLKTLRQYVHPNGLLAITIRPPDFWDHHASSEPTIDASQLKAAHYRDGIAFIPHTGGLEPVGQETYGDTSMTTEWIRKSVPQWRLVRTDRSMDDPYQLILFLKPN